MDLKLSGSDLAIEGNGLVWANSVDAIAQHLRIKLRFFLSEYHLDTSLGIPMYEDVLVKNPNRLSLQSIYREIILETEGVVSIDYFNFTFDRATRRMLLDFDATVDGAEEPLEFREFLLNGEVGS